MPFLLAHPFLVVSVVVHVADLTRGVEQPLQLFPSEVNQNNIL